MAVVKIFYINKVSYNRSYNINLIQIYDNYQLRRNAATSYRFSNSSFFWSTVFNDRFDSDELKIDNKDLSEVKREDLPDDDYQALILLMIGYPESSIAQCLEQVGLIAEHQRIASAAAAMGRLDVLNWLKEEEPDLIAKLKEWKNEPFNLASTYDQLDTLEWFKEQATPDELRNMIRAEDYTGFTYAAIKGHLGILDWYKKQMPDELMDMIRVKNYRSFYHSAQRDCLNSLNWFKEEVQKAAPEDFMRMIEAENYYCFQSAAEYGHVDILEWHYNEAPQALINMLRAENYRSFAMAAENGHLDVLKWLKETASEDEFQAMLQYDDFYAFHFASLNNHLETANWLLSNPPCFAYTEQFENEYGNYVDPFIADTLVVLHQESAASQNSGALFDIDDPERARLCFYLIRNMIRRDDRTFDEELRFLLNIPAVRALAHQEITQGYSNELLRFALLIDNQVAVNLLRTIDAVRQLAIENNNYPDDRIDLRRLAEDRESSMTALTTAESSKLEEVIKRYQPMVEQAGIETII